MFHIQVFPPSGNQFASSFEDFAKVVQAWPSMFLEMDGSFVWPLRENERETQANSSVHQSVGQIDGMIYDLDGRIVYAELKGTGPVECWLRVFRAIAPELFESDRKDQLEIVDCTNSYRFAMSEWFNSHSSRFSVPG